jgi:hypothetical protein
MVVKTWKSIWYLPAAFQERIVHIRERIQQVERRTKNFYENSEFSASFSKFQVNFETVGAK